MTCWRRLRDWQQAGVWDLIHFALLDWLARDDRIDRGYDAEAIRHGLRAQSVSPAARSVRQTDIHETFLSLGCALICWHALLETWTLG